MFIASHCKAKKVQRNCTKNLAMWLRNGAQEYAKSLQLHATSPRNASNNCAHTLPCAWDKHSAMSLRHTETSLPNLPYRPSLRHTEASLRYTDRASAMQNQASAVQTTSLRCTERLFSHIVKPLFYIK